MYVCMNMHIHIYIYIYIYMCIYIYIYELRVGVRLDLAEAKFSETSALFEFRICLIIVMRA